MTVQAFNNLGTLYLEGKPGDLASLDVTGQAAPAVLVGAVHVDDNALLEFAGGAITTVASTGTLVVNGPSAFVAVSGATASNSALTTLSNNAGSVTLTNGMTLNDTPVGGTFINSGSFAIDGDNVGVDGLGGGSTAGAEVTIAGNFDNSGTLGVDNYNFFGEAGGSTLTITGTLTNSGTVQIGNASGLSIQTTAPATLDVGALANTGSIHLAGATGAQATLDVASQAAPSVVTGGLFIGGVSLLQFASGGINSVAAGGTLSVAGANAFVAITGAASSESALETLSSNAGTVVLEDGVTLTTTPVGGTFSNSGTFAVESNNVADNNDSGGPGNSAITINGNFDNTGSLYVDEYSFFGTAGGSTLAITGTLTNATNAVIQIGNHGGFGVPTTVAPATVNAAGLDNSGTIYLYGLSGAQATLDVAGVAPATLDGSINLRGVALVEFGSGSFTSVAADGSLTLTGPQAFIADSSNTTANGALSGLTSNAGTISLNDSSLLSISGSFANSSTFDVDNGDAGGSTVSVAGTLTDSGSVVIGNNGLTTTAMVTAGGLNVTGTLILTGTTSAVATLDVTGPAPSVFTGVVTLNKNALLEFGSGSFTTIAQGASLTLNGSGALVADTGTLYDSALSGLSTNDGTLSLLNGAGVTVTGGLSNAGSLFIDAAGNSSGGSSLSVAGTLDNQVTLTIGNGNLGSGSRVIAGALINEGDGTVTLSAGANGANADLIVQTTLINDGILQEQPGGFIEAGTLNNAGILDLTGSAGVPTDLGVIGDATNSGVANIGSFAQLGVTGNLTDSGSITLAGTLDVANGLTVAATGSILLQGGSIIDPPAGSLTIAAGGELVGNGTVDEPIINNGTITAAGGLLTLNGSVSGTGQLNVGAGASLDLGGTDVEGISFGGNVGTAKFENPAGVTGPITGLVAGDAIDLAGIQATSAFVNGSTLTVSDGSQTLSYQVSGAGLSGNVFAIENDQHGGTNLVLGAPGPVIGGPTTQMVFVEYPAILGPLAVYDPTAGSGVLTVVVTAGSGLLAAIPANGGTVTGNVSSSVTLTGTLAQINTELAGLAYVGFNAGVDNVTVSVTDSNNLTTIQKIAVTVAAVPNTQPVLNAPSEIIEISNLPTAIPGVSLNDPYAQATGQYNAIELTSGQPTIFTANGTGGVVLGQGTSDLAVAGSTSQVNGYFADDALAEVGAALSYAEYGIGTFAKAASFVYTIYRLESKPSDLETLQSGADLLVDILAKARDMEIPKPLFPFAFFQVGATAVNFYLGALNALAAGEETPDEEDIVNFVGKLLNALIGLSVFPTGEDVHIVSSGGVSYEFSAAGEFVLTESTQPGNSFQVQIRLTAQNGSQSVSVITQAAVAVGSDRVTFGIGRSSFVQIDGMPANTLSPTTPVVLAGGEVEQISANSYKVVWNTGETLTITNNGTYLDLVTELAGSDGAGSVAGLLGPSNGAANDFTLPNGTVLSQPLTSADLYGTFANAWRVTDATSLFDYGPGQSTSTFTNTSFPQASVTLAQLEAGLPAALIQQAQQVVAAAGITDPGVQQLAEFDYLSSGGDPNVVAEDASQLQGASTVLMIPSSSSPPPSLLAVFPTQVSVPQAPSGVTPVTFNVDLTAPEISDTVVDYTVISPEAGDLTAQAFGGTLPTGQITIAAGASTGEFTIDVPQGALGILPAETVAVQISSPGNVPVFAGIARETVTQPVAGPPAVPELEYLGNFGNFSRDGNNYTLDLGAVQIGELLPALQFGVVNAASAPADLLAGTFSVTPVAGFSVTSDSLPAPIAAGQSFNGLTVDTNQFKFGANSETITFNPIDTNSSGFAAPLTPVTLTIADTLELPGMVYSQAFGDVHIITYNGLKYDFQATGDFTLAQSRVPGDNFAIQLRLAPWLDGASVTTIQQVAIALGADRVTFDWTRPDTVLVDGVAPVTLSTTSPLKLAGGTITEISPEMFKVDWATGETMTVSSVTPFYPGLPAFIDVTDGIPGNYGPEAFTGLQGENAGMQNDFQLANGTVLPQPLTTAELYGAFANAWQVSPANSLFDGSGPAFSAPADPMTLADLPANLVAQAAQLVAAAGITDPGLAQSAELDYLATGDPAFIAATSNIQQQVGATLVADAAGGTPAPALGVGATATKLTESATGPTTVTFTAYLTSPETTDTTVNFTVNAPAAGFLGVSAFGGTLPSGSVVIAAGQTSAPITIHVPQGALGTDPSDNLQVEVSDQSGIPVFAPTAQTEIVNSVPEPGAAAQPAFAKIAGDGTLAFNAATNTYTLSLGGLIEGNGLQPVQLALINAAGAPADSLDGTFTAPTGNGFLIAGNNLPSPLGAGQSYQDIFVSVNTFATGTHSMSMMFNPSDVNDSDYSAALAPITLNIVDSVTAPAQVAINTPTTIIFPNVRVGGIDSQHVSVTNTAAAGAANLDVTLSASGNAIGTGAITGLAPGVTDATDLSVGIDTSAAGARSGGVTENFVSDAGGGNTLPIAQEDPYIDVFGSVYRPAAFTVQPNNLTVHVGDPGTQSLTITNTDPNDGYSENLIATVIGTTGGVMASGSTGDIAPLSTGALALHFSTATAGLIGTVTLDLKSDGIGIDGLGQLDLGQVTVPVTVTPTNVAAQATIEELSGGGTFAQHGSVYTLDLGTISGPATINLGVLNSAIAPADTLGGNFSITGDSVFNNTGFAAFTGLASGATDAVPTVAFAPTTAGLYTETITLNALDETGSGTAALSNETLIITAKFVPQLAGQANIISVTEETALPDTTVLGTFTDTNTADSAGIFTASVDWGDGTTTSASVTGGNGSFTVDGGHTYVDEGSFPLAVTITDTTDNKTLPLAGTVAVAEGDALSPQGVNITANPGQSFSGTVATFTDTDTVNVAGDFTASIDWGDGTKTAGVITDVAGAISVSGTHAYAGLGQDTVTVTVTDDSPGTAAASAISTVHVVAPQTTGQLSGQVNLTAATEGIALASTTTVATFSDTDTTETASAFSASITWGDGNTTSGVVSGGIGSFTVTGGHTYADEGSNTAVVTITRTADNAQIMPSGTVAVADAALTGSSAASVTATEGASAQLTNATFTDANPGNNSGNFTATINWGDGTPTTIGTVSYSNGVYSVAGSHTYADENSAPLPISVAVTDDGGQSTTITGRATVADAALTGSSAASVTATEGASAQLTNATFTDANPGNNSGNFTATINWGDGTPTTTGTVSYSNGVYSVAGSHTYADESSAPLPISVAVTDDGGPSTTITGSATITDAPLTATGASLTGTEGAAINTTVATFTDANPDATAVDFTATINWGDGKTSAGAVAANAVGGFSVTGSHTYADESSYQVSVSIVDDGGSTASAASTATVGDATLAAVGANVTAAEGSLISAATVATFTDANPGAVASDFTASIDWGDGTPTTVGTIVAQNGGFAVDGAHSYADEGSYTIGVAITDDGGSTASATSTAAVGDAALAAVGANVTATEGGLINGAAVAFFTDANPGAVAGDFAATITWGDGTPTTVGTIVAQNGGFAVDGAHSYADEGSYTIGVTITDDGGSTASATSTATVADADVLTGQGANLQTDANQALTDVVLATFTDTYTSNGASDFTATINWGDGTSTAGTVAGGNGKLTVSGTHTYTTAGQDTVTVTLSDDAPGTATATATSSITVNPAVATAPQLVITEGVTNINITNFLGGGPITSVGPIIYPDHLPQKGYTLTLLNGQVYLSIANNLPSGGDLSAPEVSFQFTENGQTETATIKAINVTPGNNSNTLDLTQSGVGPYDFSYIAGQPHGQSIIFAPGSDTNVLAFTATSDSTPEKFDTVSSFDPSTDLIDLSEIPGVTSIHSLGIFTAIPTGSIVAPDSVAWLVDTATNQTLVFVDTTATAQTAVAASMEIVLNGQLSLKTSDFVLSEPPLALTVGNGALTLPEGGSVALPITVSPLDLDDTISVTISGLTSYESVTDNLDHGTFSGGKTGSITLTAPEINSGLSLNSSYTGSGKPVNTLSVTAANTTPGETATTAPQNIVVTDPPPSADQDVAAATISNGAPSEISRASANALTFAGPSGILQLDQSQSFRGALAGFGGWDQIDPRDIAFVANTSLGYSANSNNNGGMPMVSDRAHTTNISLLSQYMAASFAASSDGHGDSIVSDSLVLLQNHLAQPHV